MARTHAVVFLVAALAFPLAGCFRPDVQFDGPLHSTRPPVVAVIDSGTNPYHSAFHTAEGGFEARAFVRTFGLDATIVPLSTGGSYDENRAADDSFWTSVEPGQLYAFENTRVLGISLLEHHGVGIVEDATVGHGTGVTSIVAREAPSAIIVAVTVSSTYCLNERFQGCFANRSIARGMAWAASQPWIDIISVSMGLRGNAGSHPDVHPEAAAYLAASRAAHASGKVVVSASGNDMTPPLADYFNGPPWVTAVGGAEAAARGESLLAGKTPDVVANFTEWIAYAGSLDGGGWSEGTSFATPNVAGTLAQALAIVRQQQEGEPPAPRETADALRAALNASALHFSPTDWDPTRPAAPNDTLRSALGASLPVIAPAQQMGWGYVHGGLAPEIARRVLEQDFSLPPEKAETEAWMRAVMAARQAYWDRVGG